MTLELMTHIFLFSLHTQTTGVQELTSSSFPLSGHEKIWNTTLNPKRNLDLEYHAEPQEKLLVSLGYMSFPLCTCPSRGRLTVCVTWLIPKIWHDVLACVKRVHILLPAQSFGLGCGWLLCYSPVPVIRLVWCTSYESVWHTSEMSSRPTWLKFFYSHFSQEFWRTNKICHLNLMALPCSVFCFGGVMIWPLGTLRLSCYILDS